MQMRGLSSPRYIKQHPILLYLLDTCYFSSQHFSPPESYYICQHQHAVSGYLIGQHSLTMSTAWKEKERKRPVNGVGGQAGSMLP